jgi:hypothetical protein
MDFLRLGFRLFSIDLTQNLCQSLYGLYRFAVNFFRGLFTPLCGELFFISAYGGTRGLFPAEVGTVVFLIRSIFWAFLGRFCRLAPFVCSVFGFGNFLASNRLNFGMFLGSGLSTIR